ncbi:MAG: adenylosuccinate synthase [Archaeoglobi archaeon]|nr:adenylosuccinate synthase [Archaeoglobi archaeon]MDK2782105.1 adenylosuccinate synthase [Archaeoglobi archaeon]
MFTVVTGAQFGDEGKGKIIDILCEDYDAVVRFQGGDNAGHTVVVGGEKFKLHLIPSGAVRGKRLLIGPGVVVNPLSLKREMDELRSRGISIGKENLGIDMKAGVIMPYHILLDKLTDRRTGIGTTHKGIGFAYQDKIGRNEIQMIDLTEEEIFWRKLEEIIPLKEAIVEKLGGDKSEVRNEELLRRYLEIGREVKECLTDVSFEVNERLERGENILAEGAQGTFLDVVHGTGKYVTSSNTISSSACVNLGVSPKKVDKIVGVAKAYTTRVGSGPFPTEIHGELGERLREIGGEFGTTTGRPRRCGWYDAVLMRKAVKLNGYTELAVTKLDVLGGLKNIKICVAYELDGKELRYPPERAEELFRCTPVYEELDGWDEDISGAREPSELPKNARAYIERIEELAGVPVTIVSVGERRDQTILWR